MFAHNAHVNATLCYYQWTWQCSYFVQVYAVSVFRFRCHGNMTTFFRWIACLSAMKFSVYFRCQETWVEHKEHSILNWIAAMLVISQCDTNDTSAIFSRYALTSMATKIFQLTRIQLSRNRVFFLIYWLLFALRIMNININQKRNRRWRRQRWFGRILLYWNKWAECVSNCHWGVAEENGWQKQQNDGKPKK